MDKKIIELLKEKLENGEIEGVLGFERKQYPEKNGVIFVNHSEGLKRIADSLFNTLNIATYLGKLKGKKVAVLVRGCEERAINVLSVENQLNREDFFLIGLPCQGIVDIRKVKSLYGGEIKNIEEKDRLIIVEGDKGRIEISVNKVLSNSCLDCQRPTSPTADKNIEGDTISPNADFLKVKEIESLSFPDRWEIFKNEFELCIRCYSCREVCPLCYCETCFVDSSDPQWVEPGKDVSDIASFHLIRMLHMAGRCVGCGACEIACPEGIKLTYLTSKIVKDVKEAFNYESGLTATQKPALSEFKQNDKGEFIL